MSRFRPDGPKYRARIPLSLWPVSLELEKHLLHDVFAQHGSLYFAEDVADDPHQSRIYAGVDSSPLGGLEKALDEKCRIGPALYWQLWRGRYGKVEADRGPCELYL